MTLDPIQEIRAVRAARMREFDGNLDKYAEYLDEKFCNANLNLVPATPKRVKPVKPAPRTRKPTKMVRKAKRATKRKPSA